MLKDYIVIPYRFELLDSNMYLILSANEKDTAWIIDPHASECAKALLLQSNIKKIVIALTHEHYDHTSGINYFKEALPSTLICQAACAQKMKDPRNNRPMIVASMLLAGTQAPKSDLSLLKAKPFTCNADITFCEKWECSFGSSTVEFVSTPGHSKGSCCVLFDRKILFSGDTVLKDTPIITRFPGGKQEDFQTKSLPYLMSLSRNIQVYPGHGTPFMLEEANWLYNYH